ncbi:MAG: tRNA 2-thiouridine(34) synthase MnmA [Gammaproteobacteria bacterium]
MSSKTVLVGMSGGVDSSVSALLLCEQGFTVEGLFMKNWEEDDTETHCAAQADLADAQKVCDTLNIPLHKVNFAAEYWDKVFAHFLAEYKAGRTPNPDILCNREIKFKAFLDYALTLGADGIATGHYAGVQYHDGLYSLHKGADPNKDQSYFLYALGQYPLSHSIFPLSGYNKTQVRALAEKAGFVNHNKKDSTGICFIGERRFKDFLQQYLPTQPGPLVTPHGDLLGEHDGLMYYTLGQRQGLGIGGQKNKKEAPWYVVHKDIANNTLVVDQNHDHPLLLNETLYATQCHWIAGKAPAVTFSCTAKVRYRQQDIACEVTLQDNEQQVMVNFKQPQWAITPGQSVVFYRDTECLGGGIIERI